MAAEQEGVYFLRLDIKNFRCFGENASLDLSDGKGNWKKWTVILGDNGTGKSSILQLLAGFEQERSAYTSKEGREKYTFFPVGLDFFEPGAIEDGSIYSQYGEVTCRLNVAVNNTKSKEAISLSFVDGLIVSAEGSFLLKLEQLKCYGYGANRFISYNKLAESKSKNSETLFNEDAKLINAEEWLLQLDYAASKESDIKTYAIKKRDKVKEILLDLLPDIEDIRFTTPTKENLKSTVQFKTKYTNWVTIHQLSLGYKTMVAWMVDLSARLFERYPDSENPLAEPAVVLIDEIDLHLHPKWQRNIFSYLNERFPKTQFIVTAHSPLVVQSAPKDANIVLLRKEENEVVIDQSIQSVNKWRLDQILTSDLFGFESARNPEVSKLLEERTELLQKDKKQLSAKDKRRLEELNELAHSLPTAESQTDIEAMEIIRKAADYLKNKSE